MEIIKAILTIIGLAICAYVVVVILFVSWVATSRYFDEKYNENE